MKYAIVRNGKVADVVLWDGNEGAPVDGDENFVPFSETAWPDALVVLIEDDGEQGVGWSYENGIFAPPAEINPPAAIPSVVTMRQARLALLAAGKYNAVQSTVQALPGDVGEAARIEWEFASEVQRDSEIVKMLAGALGLDGDALDDLFVTAAAL